MKNIITGCLFFCTGVAIAQKDTAFWNKKMLDIAHKGEYKGWVNIKEEYLFTKNDFFSRNKEAFQLASNDSMRYVSSTKKDELGYIRHLFQQTYKGIEIEGAQYKLHEKDGRIFCANGYLVEKITCSIEPKISEATALKYALEHIRAKIYAWEIDYNALFEEDEEELRYYKETPAYHYPKGTLILTQISDSPSMRAENFVLAYKFEISSIEPSSSTAIYVNAHIGEIIKNNSLVFSSNCHNGNAHTLHYGWQTIVTYKRSGNNGKYILRDECRGHGIETKEEKGIGSSHYTDADNQWSLESERPATSVHWAMGQTYDYFYDVHGRNGHYTSNSKPIISWIVEGMNGGETDPKKFRFRFGTGDGVDRTASVTLDVVGHEYTHAILFDAIGIPNMVTTRALHESFCDIFGAMVKFYYYPNSNGYFIGEHTVVGRNGILRDMTNPHNTQIPGPQPRKL